MIYYPAPRGLPNQICIGPYDRDVCPTALVVKTTASGTWGTANKAYFYPFRLIEPFIVQKAFWLNGTTVGTDSIDIGMYRMTDFSTGRLNLIRSTGAILSAGASSLQASGTWKVARVNLTAGNDSTDSATYTTASITLKAGRLYLIAVENSHGSSAAAISSIDNGPTFVNRSTTQYNSTLNRVSIWSAVPINDYTGTLVINFGGGNTQTGCIWSLNEMSGVDTSASDGIVQQAVGTGNSGTALATLGAFGSTANATFGAHGHAAATASAPGTGFTELSDTTTATPAQALCTDWRVDNDTTVDATFTSAEWGSCAVEVKADTSPFIIPASTDLYMGMAISGTTATIFRDLPADVVGARMAGCLELTSAFPLPSSCIPVALTALRNPAAGFSSRVLLD